MIINRSEILFLYDVAYANPNGDPVDNNKPRIDEESGINIVTDVRLKRTIRDYWYNNKSLEIFVREIADEKDIIQDAKKRAEDFLTKDGAKLNKKDFTLAEMKKIIHQNMMNECIDIRTFGVTLPIEKNSNEKGSITLTGPVQFKFGRSLHKVKLEYIKGTGAFASKEGATQKTFREEYVLPYSLIAFYGIVNENAAKDTGLTDSDVSNLMEATWDGTKNLISRSKAGQQPRLLLRVAYKGKNYHIGELDKYLGFETQKVEEEIRDITDINLDASKLIAKLVEVKEKIDYIEIALDSRVKFVGDLVGDLNKNGIKVNELKY